MPEIIAMMCMAILFIASVTVVGLVRADKKRKRLAAEQARPLSSAELHRQRYLETGDQHELDLMYDSLEE